MDKMTEKEARRIIEAFALYSHDEHGEVISKSIIDDFLKFRFKRKVIVGTTSKRKKWHTKGIVKLN